MAALKVFQNGPYLVEGDDVQPCRLERAAVSGLMLTARGRLAAAVIGVVVQCRNDASWLLLPRFQDRGDRGAVGRAAADIVESHGAGRIDEDIAAELSRVRAGVSRQPAARELFRTGPPGPQSPDVPQMSPMHTVSGNSNGIAGLPIRLPLTPCATLPPLGVPRSGINIGGVRGRHGQ